MRNRWKKLRQWLSAKDLGPEELGLRHLVPAILMERVFQSTVSIVDVAFLSRISDSVVSAVSISTQYIQICQTIASAVATGAIVCITQAVGMHAWSRVERLSNVAIAANTILGLFFGLFFVIFAEPFLSIMQISSDSLAAAAEYMRIVGGTMVIPCMQMVMSNICRAKGMSQAPLAINLCINVVNILGCAFVVYYPMKLPFSPITGVAVVNVISQIAGLALATVLFLRSGIRIQPKQLKPFPWTDLRLVLSIGIPSGITNMAYGSSQLITTAIIALTGEINVTAKVYINNIVNYVSIIGAACGSAAMILIGYRIGAGKYDEVMKLRRRVTNIALVSNTVCSLLLVLFRSQLLGFFTDNEMILSIASAIMLFDVFVEIGRALNNTISGALMATGDVVYQLVINQGSAWLVSVGLSYILGVKCGYGLYGVWIAFALDEAVRGLILLYRWNSKRWMVRAEKNRLAVASNMSEQTD